MALIPAKCTNCGAKIEVDDTKEAGICSFCGTAFITEKVINNYISNTSFVSQTNVTKIIQGGIDVLGYEEFLKKARDYLIANEFNKALNTLQKAMDEEPTRFEAYLQYGSEFCKKNNHMTKIELADIYVKYFKKALQFAPENAKESVKNCIKESTMEIIAYNRLNEKKAEVKKEIDSVNLSLDNKIISIKDKEKDFDDSQKKKYNIICDCSAGLIISFVVLAVLWAIFRFKIGLPQVFSFLYALVRYFSDTVIHKLPDSPDLLYYANSMTMLTEKFPRILLIIGIVVFIAWIVSLILKPIILSASKKSKHNNSLTVDTSIKDEKQKHNDKISEINDNLNKYYQDFKKRILQQTSDEYIENFFSERELSALAK